MEGSDQELSPGHQFDFERIADPDLVHLLKGCVSQDPDQRFESIRQVCPALADWQGRSRVKLRLHSLIDGAIRAVYNAERIDQEWTDASLEQLAQDRPATLGPAPSEPILFKYIAPARPDILAEGLSGTLVKDLEEPEESIPPTLRLIPLSDTDTEFVMPPSKERAEIGRSLSNDLVIRDEEISRSHTTLARRGGLVFVRDNNSRLGTFVNDERVVERRLKDGDLLRFGDHDFRVELSQDYADISLLQSETVSIE
jgi:hypothetical protein